ncbi:MAG: patatin-like phospholipase family protein [Deltaproteobacteria bacterium]|nr:patatin-like phospholipase family protein [Deltaproteobacteria bacterium]
MTRPKVALVGSGGAAKGIAHLGTLRALEELGIRPDIFVGTSAGALVAALYGQGVPLDVLIDSYRLPWERRYPDRKLVGLTFAGLPNREQLSHLGYLTSGVFSIDPLERYLRRVLPNNDFRKTERPILVTAADVDGRGRVVFGRGHVEDIPISQAVAASCCVPLLFRPYRIGDRYLVDGEVVRTLSVDLAIEHGAEIVVIANVYRPHVTKAHERSFAMRGLDKMAVQTLNIVLSEKEKRGIELYHRLYPHVTFVDVSPDVGRYSFLNRFVARELISRGYREALRQIASVKARGLLDGIPPPSVGGPVGVA